ncbi:hypothetical protein MMC27_001458 [Xylographa pallens]|nr:hypothetical protein [Xylographa pallens]
MSGWDQQEVCDEEYRFKQGTSRDPWDPPIGTDLAEWLDTLSIGKHFLLGNEKWVIKGSFNHGSTSAAVKIVCNARRNTELFVCKAVLHRKFTQQVPKEVRILRDILPNNARLCAFSEYFPAPKNVFLMEYCNGGDLERIAFRYRQLDDFVPESFLWHILLQVAEGLAFLHHGRSQTASSNHAWGSIIHADIKPENLFLQWRPGSDPAKDYPDLKIGDFGLSIIVNERTDKPPYAYPAGTFAWKPPEQPFITFKADVWALGAVIHYLCHGKEPIEVWGPDWPPKKTTRQTMPITKFYSSTLQYWLDQTLKLDAVERIDSATLADSLAGIVPPLLKEKKPLDAWAAGRALRQSSTSLTRNEPRDSQDQEPTAEASTHDDEPPLEHGSYAKGHSSRSFASNDDVNLCATLLQELNAKEPEYTGESDWPLPEQW